MTSAHTTFRDLVAHLARAQRAFDAGRVEEAEHAISDALAIDPENVQAADLRRRLSKARPPAASPQTGPAPAAAAKRRAVTRAASPGRAEPEEAWSTFEQRIRARRADRAVAEARNALDGGDWEAARAALAELDSVSPGDLRREPIVASLEAGGAAAQAWVAAPRQPVATRPVPARAVVSQTVTSPPVVSASAPPDIGAITLDRDMLHPDAVLLERDITGTATAPRPGTSSVAVRKPWRAAAAGAMGVVAASALLGFWLFATRPDDSLWTTTEGQASTTEGHASPAPQTVETPAASIPDATQSEFAIPPTVPSFVDPFAESVTGGETVGTLREPADDASRADTKQPAGTASAAASVNLGQPTRTPVIPSRSTPDTRLSEAGRSLRRPTDRVVNTAAAEPAPAPLETPTQALNPPDTRQTVNPRVDGLTVPSVTPLPAPPPASVASPPAPVATRGTAEVSAVRSVLDGYADAFSTLDANATQRVWPGADVRGLTRAFDQLTAQTITFNRCDVNASGETADAVCVGRATWVPKVGDRSPKSEQRTWRFALGRDGDGWVIDRVQVQR